MFSLKSGFCIESLDLCLIQSAYGIKENRKRPLVGMTNKDLNELCIVAHRQKDKEKANYREGCLSGKKDEKVWNNRGLNEKRTNTNDV